MRAALGGRAFSMPRLLVLLSLHICLFLAPCAAQSVIARSTMGYAQSNGAFMSAYGFPYTSGSPSIDLYFYSYDLWTTVASPDSSDRWYAATAGTNDGMFVTVGGFYRSDMVVVNITGVNSAATALTAPNAQSRLLVFNGAAYACAATVWTSEVVWAGGETATGTSSAMHYYNPTTDTFRNVNVPSLSVGRSRAGCSAFGGSSDGFMIAGGRDGTGAMVAVIEGWIASSDPQSPVWATILGGLALNPARELVAAAATATHVIFAGGFDGTSYRNEVDIIKLADYSITSATLSTARAGVAIAYLNQVARMLIIGGVNATSTSEFTDILDTGNGAPTPISVTTFNTSRWLLSAVGLYDRAFAVGGQRTQDDTNASGVVGTVDSWNAATGFWTTIYGGIPAPGSSLTTPPPTTPAPTTTSPSPSSAPSTLPQQTTTPPVCVDPAPIAGAICMLGVWTVRGDVNITGPLVASSPISITGDATFVGAEVVASGSAVPITIGGDAFVSGVLVLTLPTAPADGQSIPILQASSINGSFSNVTVNKQYSDCDTVSGTPSQTTASISVLMSVDEKKCSKGLSTGAIIGIAVGGAFALVILCVFLFAIALACDARWAKRILKGARLKRQSRDLGVYER